ncbi:hypothetical protein KIF59_13430 [Enterobacter cloacae subsp. cloacae]|nr:hypothetical protein [Enterobacter cloacae subsp. cloacae]
MTLAMAVLKRWVRCSILLYTSIDPLQSMSREEKLDITAPRGQSGACC